MTDSRLALPPPPSTAPVAPTLGTADPDQLDRCLKKPKTTPAISSASVMEVVPSPIREDVAMENESDHVDPTPPPPWSRSFADTVRQESPEEDTPQYYMGEDEEEKYPGIDELFSSPSLVDNVPPAYGPALDISKEKYISLFKPWRGALIIKLLGKSITYRLMHQRTTSL